MKKRNIIIVIATIIFLLWCKFTNNPHILFFVFDLVVSILLLDILAYLCLTIFEIYDSNKSYRKLVKLTEEIKLTEKLKYKSYFSLSGKNLKRE